jgi:hypothetical protein
MIEAHKLEGEDRQKALAALADHGWTVVEGRDAITKRFVFSDFNDGLRLDDSCGHGGGAHEPPSRMVQRLQDRRGDVDDA